jgi:hypothetical protein
MPNPATYFLGSSIVQKPAPAALPSSTAPVFAGIVSATPNTDGSITAAWAAGTTVNPPIEYIVYIAVGSVSPAALFVSANAQRCVPTSVLSTRIFTLADQTTYLINGQTYTLGVRARDAYSNTETNTVIQTATAIASGNLPAVLQTLVASLAVTDANLSTDHANFQVDHANFQSDHTNFQSDHTNFQADHLAFQGDHSNFQTDHANFQTDHTNLAATAADLDSTASDLAATSTDLDATASDIAATEALLAADVSALGLIVGGITPSNGTVMIALGDPQTVMVVDGCKDSQTVLLVDGC